MSVSLDEVQAQLAELTATVRMLAERLPTLVTIPEAARIFGVSVRTVRRRIKLREWPHVKVGREVRLDLAVIRPMAVTQGR